MQDLIAFLEDTVRANTSIFSASLNSYSGSKKMKLIYLICGANWSPTDSYAFKVSGNRQDALISQQ